MAEHGYAAMQRFQHIYPGPTSQRQHLHRLDLERMLDGADLVLVHEWNDHHLVHRIGKHRAPNRGYRLLFHDTHHRSVTDSATMSAYDLSHYDGVSAFGEVICELYLARGWAARAWTWHEAADTRMFHPIEDRDKAGDMVWVGNWGDDERSAELAQFLINPVKSLGLKALVHGVRYPRSARTTLAKAGITYAG